MLGVRDPELETRWIQSGVFSPIMRLHSSNNPFTRKEPWVFEEPHCAIQEEYLRFRHRLVGYLHSEQFHGRDELLPLVRPMYWEHDGHAQAWEVPNCFRFGRELIAAPVTEQLSEASCRGRSEAWLPEGMWVDLMTNIAYQGNRKLSLWSELSRTPLFARSGSIIPLCGSAAAPDGEGTLGMLGRQANVGTGNPEEIELLLVCGADASYELVEDRDSDASLVRTLFEWDDARHRLTIHGADGDLDSIPVRRKILVRTYGHGIDTQLTDLGFIETGTGAVFDIEPKLMSEEVKRSEQIRRILTHARCEVETLTCLDSTWNEGRGAFFAALSASGVAPDLREALFQIAIASDL